MLQHPMMHMLSESHGTSCMFIKDVVSMLPSANKPATFRGIAWFQRVARAAAVTSGMRACVGQAVHTPTRRREELSATPSAAMRGVAVHLAAELRNTLLDAQARPAPPHPGPAAGRPPDGGAQAWANSDGSRQGRQWACECVSWCEGRCNRVVRTLRREALRGGGKELGGMRGAETLVAD